MPFNFILLINLITSAKNKSCPKINCHNISSSKIDFNCSTITNQKNESKNVIEDLIDPKKNLLKKISKSLHRNITVVNSLFLKQDQRFGNNLISLSNAIFYCEILKCKEVIIDNSLVFINYILIKFYLIIF